MPPSAGVISVSDIANSSRVRAALHWLTRERQWLNEKHLDLCRVAAPTFFEQRRAEWMAEEFRRLGWEAKIDRAGNVIAMRGPDTGHSLIAVTAHLDTVLAPRSPDDIRVEGGGRFHGPGVSDNGAGLAGLLAIAACAREFDVPGGNSSLLLVANVGEEGEGNLSGMRYLCKQSPLASRIRAFLVLDGPATGHITCQALASRRFEVSFAGPGGHSWSDYGIGNPAHALARSIHFFTEKQHGEGGPARLPRSSFNFGVIEGGVSVNSIPSSARGKLDIRSASNERLDDLAELLTACVERSMEVENGRSTGGRVTAKIRELGARPGGKLPEDAPLLQHLRAVDHFLSIRAQVDCASTDANIPLSMGLPALSIGAGGHGGGAHTPQEWFHPEGRDIGLRRVLLTLCMLAND